jgi:hypothetical protein
MALWIESAAREASVSPGTCGEKRRREEDESQRPQILLYFA